jgi:hypothetical protein
MVARSGSSIVRLLMVIALSWLIAAAAGPAPANAAPQVTPLVDAANGQLVAFARGSGGDVVEFGRSSNGGQWVGYDLSAIYGVAQAAGPVLPYTDPDYGSEPIAFAQGFGGDVLQYERPGGIGIAWRWLDLSAPFGLGTTDGEIVPWTDAVYGNSLVAMQVASDGDAVTISRHTGDGTWQRYDLSAAFGVSRFTGPLLPYSDPDYGSSLIAFGSAPAGHVIQLVRQTSGGTWGQVDLTAAFGAPLINASGVVPYTDPNYGSSLIAFAVSTGGDVLTFARQTQGGAWNHYDLSSAFGLPRTGGPVEPATDPASGELLAFYPGGNGDVVEAQRNAAANGAWSASDLSAQFGLSPVAGPLIPFRDPGSGQLILFGESAAGNALEFVRESDNSWQQVNMGAVDAALKSLPTPPVSPPPAASPSPPPSSSPTPIPVPHGRRALKIRVVLYWTWLGRVTTLDRVRVLTRRLPHRLRVRVTCRGHGCPFKLRHASGARRVRRDLGGLKGRHFRAGDELRISFTLRGRRPDTSLVTIRNNRIPRVRLAR